MILPFDVADLGANDLPDPQSCLNVVLDISKVLDVRDLLIESFENLRWKEFVLFRQFSRHPRCFDRVHLYISRVIRLKPVHFFGEVDS